VVTQQYPPDELVGRDYYHPTGYGAERVLAERVPKLRRTVRGETDDRTSTPGPGDRGKD
jgi:putative ATPase